MDLREKGVGLMKKKVLIQILEIKARKIFYVVYYFCMEIYFCSLLFSYRSIYFM